MSGGFWKEIGSVPMKDGRYLIGYSGHQPTHLAWVGVLDRGKWYASDAMTPLRVIPDLFAYIEAVPYLGDED